MFGLNSPITALGSVPNAHTQGEPEGTWNLEKLHLELKYLGRKLAEAKLQRQQRDRLELSKFNSKYLSRAANEAEGNITRQLHAKRHK